MNLDINVIKDFLKFLNQFAPKDIKEEIIEEESFIFVPSFEVHINPKTHSAEIF